MSVELPEAQILATQMNEQLRRKKIRSASVHDCQRMQKIGFINRNARDFDALSGTVVQNVAARGNTIRVRLSRAMNLLLAPEYGGRVLFHPPAAKVPAKVHLKVEFADGSALTARLKSMGMICAVPDSRLGENYMVRRDFSGNPAPLDRELTLRRFRELLAGRNQGLKTVLVGKEAVVVGLSNSAFQDILYRAGLHPKRKGSELDLGQSRALYDSMRALIRERLELGGKDEFEDLHGVRGRYAPRMGPASKGRWCGRCGTRIERLAHGGGQVYLCPTCQPENLS